MAMFVHFGSKDLPLSSLSLTLMQMTVRFDFEPDSKYSIFDAQSGRCEGNIEHLYRAVSISSANLRPFIFTRVINRLSQ